MEILSLSSVECAWQGILNPGDTGLWGLQTCRGEWACLPLPRGVCLLCFEWSCLAARNLRCSALACPVPGSLLSQEAQTQTLYSVHSPPAHQPLWAGPHNPFSMQPSNSPWLSRFSGHELCVESGLLVDRAAVCVWACGFPAQPCVSSSL